MFTRITKFQRLDYMQQGFIHLGYSSGVAEMLYTKSHEQLTRVLDKLINNLNVSPSFDRYIAKHTLREMTDNKGGVYSRRGKSYLYKNVLIHLYDKGYTATVMLVNI